MNFWLCVVVQAALAQGATPPAAPTPEARPRYAAGVSFGFAQIAGGSRQRDEGLSWGLTAERRLLPALAVAFRYSHVSIAHDYEQIRFDSGYHRFALGPEWRVPIGLRFDLLASVVPELTLLRSSVAAGGDAAARGRGYLGAAARVGCVYRTGKLQWQADFSVSFRDQRTDRNVIVAGAWTWP